MTIKFKIEKVNGVQKRTIIKPKKTNDNLTLDVEENSSQLDKPVEDVINQLDETVLEEKPEPKKRGRKKKVVDEETILEEKTEPKKRGRKKKVVDEETILEEKPEPKKRGRKKKVVDEANVEEVCNKIEKTHLEEECVCKKIKIDENLEIKKSYNHPIINNEENLEGLEENTILYRMDLIGYKTGYRPYLLFTFFTEKYRKLDKNDKIDNMVLKNVELNNNIKYSHFFDKETSAAFIQLHMNEYHWASNKKNNNIENERKVIKMFQGRETFFFFDDKDDGKIWDYYSEGNKEEFKKSALELIDIKEKREMVGVPFIFNDSNIVNQLTLIKKIIINF